MLRKYKVLSLIITGLLIGMIAGVFGAGGGIMILLALIFILDYSTHEAIGTSVFLMIFIALFGGIGHYLVLPFSLFHLFIGAIGGIFGSFLSSKFANVLDERTLNKLVGVAISLLGVLLVLKSVFLF